MMKYQIRHSSENNEGVLRDMIFNKTLTAPEAGVYSLINLAGPEVDFKNHLLDSMEQISTWLRNLKKHGYIDVDDQNRIITVIQ